MVQIHGWERFMGGRGVDGGWEKRREMGRKVRWGKGIEGRREGKGEGKGKDNGQNRIES